MKIAKRIILAGCFSFSPFFCFSWGVLGHRIVGQIAESYLTPQGQDRNSKNSRQRIYRHGK